MSALAHEGRLRLFRRLVVAGYEGLAVGDLAEAVEQNFGTASAQLLVLANAGLVEKQRKGRSIIYFANFKEIQGLIAFLMQDCCQGRVEIMQPLADIAADALCCNSNKGEPE